MLKQKIKPGEPEDLVLVLQMFKRFESMDQTAFDRLLDEVGKEQPLLISLFLGYRAYNEYEPAQLEALLPVLFVIWLFHKERFVDVLFRPVTEANFEAVTKEKQDMVMQHMNGNFLQSGKEIDRFLDPLQPRALFAHINRILITEPLPSLRGLSEEERHLLNFDCMVLIDCLQDQVKGSGT
ncbi:MAG: hypothetical protein V4539_06635 [Bacteroidota bacterium]